VSGKREVKVLFEEANGVYLSMQGKSRNKRKRKKEFKIGIAYEGWQERYPGSKEYKTVEKIAYAGYLTPEEFSNLREAYVCEKYNVDEIKYRILNGDGAAWIEKGHDCEGSVFQLDPYHLSKSVIRAVKDKKARAHIFKWLKKGELDKVYEKIEALKYNCDGLVSEIKKLSDLRTYLKTHEKGIKGYQSREEIKTTSLPRRFNL
jgi:hypothetical protein